MGDVFNVRERLNGHKYNDKEHIGLNYTHTERHTIVASLLKWGSKQDPARKNKCWGSNDEQILFTGS